MAMSLPYPALHASHAGIWVSGGGGASGGGRASASRRIGRSEALALITRTPVILLNAAMARARLADDLTGALDLLELFAFVHPAQPLVPTPAGIAVACGLAVPADDASAPETLLAAATTLITTLDAGNWHSRAGAVAAGRALVRLRWSWSPLISEWLSRQGEAREPGLFDALPQWEEKPPRPAPRSITVDPDDAASRLATLAGSTGELRAGQVAMARAAADVFAPRTARDAPRLMLAEAGTGIGKTLAYLAPGAAWVEASGGTLWLSTYTKALQRQLRRETARLYPDAASQAAAVVVRKGRENYLCLLNLEEAVQGAFTGQAAVFAQLVVRWARYSADGDMVGGDLPGWLTALFRRSGATALTDRRGECIYAACPHWQRCFIERSIRRSQDADFVIANHALMLFNAARGDGRIAAPTRIIFDEGHHLYDAADATFAAALTGREGIDLRRWLLGNEGAKRGRRRGLAARLAGLIENDSAAADIVEIATTAAQQLPSDGWLGRLDSGTADGAIEQLLLAVHGVVQARSGGPAGADVAYGIEADLTDAPQPLVTAAEAAIAHLSALHGALHRLSTRIEALLENPPDWLEAEERSRIDGARSALGWRRDAVVAWVGLIKSLIGARDPRFVDWGAIERSDGRDIDVGLHRHWLDPTEPLAGTVLSPLHGALVTSATLALGDWDRADARIGVPHLAGGAQHFVAESPFDYARQSEVLIVTDVRPRDIAAMTGAFAQLLEAAGGGTLGLFTSIRRLRQVHARLADRLARLGLPLLAQHVDPVETGTVVDMFRDDPHSSLLGTDALRDGIDVPGHALRQLIMEGVPWSRPTVLHGARRRAFGGAAYEDSAVRTRLAQAFGRLVRRQDDGGRFIILAAAFPSRLLSAFPAATQVRRVTLAEAVEIARHPLPRATQRA